MRRFFFHPLKPRYRSRAIVWAEPSTMVVFRTFKCPLTFFFVAAKISFQLMSSLNAHSRLSNYFSFGPIWISFFNFVCIKSKQLEVKGVWKKAQMEGPVLEAYIIIKIFWSDSVSLRLVGRQFAVIWRLKWQQHWTINFCLEREKIVQQYKKSHN